jgi:hypothetical protein
MRSNLNVKPPSSLQKVTTKEFKLFSSSSNIGSDKAVKFSSTSSLIDSRKDRKDDKEIELMSVDLFRNNSLDSKRKKLINDTNHSIMKYTNKRNFLDNNNMKSSTPNIDNIIQTTTTTTTAPTIITKTQSTNFNNKNNITINTTAATSTSSISINTSNTSQPISAPSKPILFQKDNNNNNKNINNINNNNNDRNSDKNNKNNKPGMAININNINNETMKTNNININNGMIGLRKVSPRKEFEEEEIEELEEKEIIGEDEVEINLNSSSLIPIHENSPKFKKSRAIFTRVPVC